jgi:hypothetical protein
MNDLELVAIIIALVGVFRARRVPGAEAFEPALDGNAVPLVAAALGGVLSLLYDPASLWLALAHGACLGLVAVGAMTTLKYVADKAGTSLGRALGRPLALARPKNGEGKAHDGDSRGREGAPSVTPAS